MRLPAFVCLLARLLKNAWMDLDDYMSTDVGIWRNRLTFEPDLDHSLDAGYRMHCNARNFITSGKSHVQVLSMVIVIRGFEASKDHCRR